jgi:hypothetical protein
MLINELNNAIIFGSAEQINDALGKTISDIVTFDRQGVINVLNKNRIKVDRNISNEKLIEILSYQFAYQNASLIHDLYPIIKGLNVYLNDNSSLKASDIIPSGDITPVGWIGAIVKGVGALVKGIGSAFIHEEKKKQKEEAENTEDEKRRTIALKLIQTAKERQAQQIVQSSNQATLDEQKKRREIYLIAGIGVGVLAVIGLIVALKNK